MDADEEIVDEGDEEVAVEEEEATTVGRAMTMSSARPSREWSYLSGPLSPGAAAMHGTQRWFSDLRTPSSKPPVGKEDFDVDADVDVNLTRTEARPMSATAGVVCPVTTTGSWAPKGVGVPSETFRSHSR